MVDTSLAVNAFAKRFLGSVDVSEAAPWELTCPSQTADAHSAGLRLDTLFEVIKHLAGITVKTEL